MHPVTQAEASRDLHIELARSRRFGRPLSVAVLRPAPADGRSGAIRGRFGRRRSPGSADALASRLAPHLRTYETLASDGPQVLIVAPETDDVGARTLVMRLATIASHEGMPVRAGSATFPQDGNRPEDLVALASRRAAGSRQPWETRA